MTRSTSPAANGSAHGCTRSSAGRSRPCGTRAGAWPSTRRHGSVDWDIASAYEAMARAYLVAGDAAEVAAWKARATVALDGIADRDDRELIEGDLATLP